MRHHYNKDDVHAKDKEKILIKKSEALVRKG